jgi:hypothetical protein
LYLPEQLELHHSSLRFFQQRRQQCLQQQLVHLGSCRQLHRQRLLQQRPRQFAVALTYLPLLLLLELLLLQRQLAGKRSCCNFPQQQQLLLQQQQPVGKASLLQLLNPLLQQLQQLSQLLQLPPLATCQQEFQLHMRLPKQLLPALLASCPQFFLLLQLLHQQLLFVALLSDSSFLLLTQLLILRSQLADLGSKLHLQHLPLQQHQLQQIAALVSCPRHLQQFSQQLMLQRSAVPASWQQ